jgi:hypothetical protein
VLRWGKKKNNKETHAELYTEDDCSWVGKLNLFHLERALRYLRFDENVVRKISDHIQMPA